MEDKEGFVWFATETGVSRFDGSVFKNFTTADGLPDNEIIKIFVDSRNRIWMVPFNHAISYYYKGKIYNEKNDSVLSKFHLRDRIQAISEDSVGNIIFMGNTSVMVLQKDNNLVYKFRKSFSWFCFYGSGIGKDLKPYIYSDFYNAGAYLYKLNIRKDSILFEKDPRAIKFYGNDWNCTYIIPGEFIYFNNENKFGDYSNLVFYNDNNNSRFIETLPSKLNRISFISDSIAFLNTVQGVTVMNYKTGEKKVKYLPDENVSCSMKDSEGNIWFTTLGNGVFRLRSEVNKIVSLNKYGSGISIESVLVNDNSIFLGTDKGTIYKLKKQNDSVERIYQLAPGLQKVLNISETPDGKVLMLGDDTFFVLENGQQNISRWSFCSNNITWSFKDIDIAKRDSFFLATHIQVFLYNVKAKLCEPFLHQRSTAVCSTDSGLYIGTISGLVFVNWKKEKTEFGKTNPLLANRITRIFIYRNKIWVGTNDNGVLCFNGREVEKTISTKNGLTGNYIRAIYADGNNLWVGTDRGLNKVDVSDTSYRVTQQYSLSDGMLSNMINCIYAIKDTVYVCTPKGLSYFDDKEIRRNSNCNLRILGITSSGKDINYDSTLIKLKHRDNNIRFDFVGISYKAEGNITYYYKLSGIDADWKTTTENFLQYPTLPSGDYELMLYAVNKFGVKSEVVTIMFKIEKRLFEETWFIVLVILLAISLILFLANARIRRIERVQREKTANAERIVALEQQALKAQMNPHFIFNCLNSIQQYVIDKDIEGANKFISGFSKLIRQTLDNSGRQSITVAEEESFLRAYLDLEKSRFEDKFDYSISIDARIDKENDSLPPMLLQPYIENCIRHGIMHKSNGKGLIAVSFQLINNNLICTVTDNGIGRKAADKFKNMQHTIHESRGTDITGQRIIMINKNNVADIILNIEDITDGEGNPAGTKVTIAVPLFKNS